MKKKAPGSQQIAGYHHAITRQLERFPVPEHGHHSAQRVAGRLASVLAALRGCRVCSLPLVERCERDGFDKLIELQVAAIDGHLKRTLGDEQFVTEQRLEALQGALQTISLLVIACTGDE